jgi:hypothetical protein
MTTDGWMVAPERVLAVLRVKRWRYFRGRRVAKIAIILMTGVLMTSTACAPTGAELYAQAKQANLRMKAEVAALQMQIYDG